jgi:phosphoribosylformylglycinamidine cyclo-ligase
LAGVELIGGETAEHGRFSSCYDLAGFCTGIVEENEIIDGSLIKPGDVVIGIESSGLHSNGYTLINDMLFRQKIFYKETPELLTPTTIYAPLVKHLLEEFPILGMAHITGGGIPGNLPRCLPEGLRVDVDYNSWPLPDIFRKVMLAGEILEEDMKTTFNMGIGFCIVVPEETVGEIELTIDGYDMRSWIIGEVMV